MAELSTVPQKDRTDLSQPETTRGGYHFVPRVDIFETENELLLLADLAGVRPEDVDLHYEKGELMLHALKEELFRLESERLDQSISAEDYAKAKSALDLLMKRVIGRK